jgi:hypothetical protein
MKTFLSVLLLLALLACGRPHYNNTNPVFEENLPASPIYKNELAQLLEQQDKDDISYWFKSYEERNSKTYLQFYVQSDSLCAVADVEVRQWDDKLADIKRTKGMGYVGAEITDLEFVVEKAGADTEFVYQSLSRIID